MEQLLEFAGNHPLLVGLFVALLVALAVNIATDGGGKNAVDPTGATALINHEGAVVVDVRSMAEFKQGHILNAINVPLNGLKSQLQTLEKHKSKPIVACCRSGSRSHMACGILRKAGFERVHNLKGGMMAWESANLPVKRKS